MLGLAKTLDALLSRLDTTISGSSKQDSNEGSRLFKIMAKSFCKRWQNGEISNFQYLMHLNTLAGRGYNDLTQYPVFPWVLAEYDCETLDLMNANAFRKLDKPIGCQTAEGEEEFKKRYESWDDPDVPKFHYGSHYSSAGIVLFYLLRLPPFSIENQKLQGGQFDHADRLFNSVRDTWFSAAGRSNTSDVKELIPEFFYMPEFLENCFHLDLGVKQSGEQVVFHSVFIFFLQNLFTATWTLSVLKSTKTAHLEQAAPLKQDFWYHPSRVNPGNNNWNLTRKDVSNLRSLTKTKTTCPRCIERLFTTDDDGTEPLVCPIYGQGASFWWLGWPGLS
eukprot:Gb_31351 [translate_table: standard]